MSAEPREAMQDHDADEHDAREHDAREHDVPGHDTPHHERKEHDGDDRLGELLASAVLDDGVGPASPKAPHELRAQGLALLARDATLRKNRRLGLCAAAVAAALVVGFVAPRLARREAHGAAAPDAAKAVVAPSTPAELATAIDDGTAPVASPRAVITVDVTTLPTAPVASDRSQRPEAARDTKRGEARALAADAAAEDLLRTANRLRGEKRWDEAMRTYERVLREHPEAEAAYAATVAAASLRLSRAGDAKEALRLYGRALALHPAGPLAEEALWGTCAAHRALGQAQEERDALRRFTERYPASWRAQEASERLAQLSNSP